LNISSFSFLKWIPPRMQTFLDEVVVFIVKVNLASKIPLLQRNFHIATFYVCNKFSSFHKLLQISLKIHSSSHMRSINKHFNHLPFYLYINGFFYHRYHSIVLTYGIVGWMGHSTQCAYGFLVVLWLLQVLHTTLGLQNVIHILKGTKLLSTFHTMLFIYICHICPCP